MSKIAGDAIEQQPVRSVRSVRPILETIETVTVWLFVKPRSQHNNIYLEPVRRLRVYTV